MLLPHHHLSAMRFRVASPLSSGLSLLLGLGVFTLTACDDSSSRLGSPLDGAESRPAPTDPRQLEESLREGEDESEEGESRRQEERQAWIEEMHRTADGVDWREIERQNQNAERVRRNQAARDAAALGGSGAARQPGSGQPWFWEEIGSRNQAGHTRCAAFGPERSGGRFLYVGSALGGVWRGSMTGENWTPLSDSIYGGVDDLAIVTPANLADDDIVLRRSGSSLLRSDDAGATWTVPQGLDSLRSGRRMLKAADALQTIYLFGTATIPGAGERSALFASIDGGLSFTLRYSFGIRWSGDIWVPRTAALGGSAVYVLQAGRIFVSTDDGFTFGAPLILDANATSGDLVGSESGGPRLYAALRVGSNDELHVSNDGGVTASYVRALDGLWASTTSMAAFAFDPQRLIYSGVEARRSTNGGATGTSINTWGSYYGDPANRLHADIRGISPLVISDAQGERDVVFINTDGGTYITEDGGMTVQNLSLEGLGVGQFYSTHTSTLDPDHISGGTQDQGYQVGTLTPSTGPGPSTDFDQTISGDYGHLCSGDGTHRFVYSNYPGFTLVQVGETNPQMRQVSFPANVDRLWLPPVIADPTDREAYFFLGSELHRFVKTPSSWTGTRWSNQDFGAGSSRYLTAMAFAPSDPNRAYALTDAGAIFRSTDRGVTWTQSAGGGPGTHYFYGASLLVDPTNPDRVFAAGSGYSTAGVRESVDGGSTWQARASGLPPTLVHDIEWAPDGSGDLFAATEAGAYHYDAATQTWSNAMGSEAPMTTYWSVEAVPSQQRVRFGTYGRGIWDLRLLTLDDTISTSYCGPAIPNSTGASATIRAIGSPFASANDVTLVAESLAPNSLGYFLASPGAGFVASPGGSQGNLCLGGSIGRYVGQVLNAGAAGEFSLPIDLTALPQPGGSVVAAPGDVWHFQAWYRDAIIGIPTSNFTDGAALLLR
ncbi:hypothetical protein Poly30_43290 [Planctomycetes bacterium Poly30]|uniref:BNR/Asp-box repeat protein n=1 Tax=Saltatorellus ferox TaxID=2528018 RepID=A0A518EXF4_9BACT|nr:hypothetical protein Poly30_43290 [Planctomycetes bacterium Poly30]